MVRVKCHSLTPSLHLSLGSKVHHTEALGAPVGRNKIHGEKRWRGRQHWTTFGMTTGHPTDGVMMVIYAQSIATPWTAVDAAGKLGIQKVVIAAERLIGWNNNTSLVLRVLFT